MLIEILLLVVAISSYAGGSEPIEVRPELLSDRARLFVLALEFVGLKSRSLCVTTLPQYLLAKAEDALKWSAHQEPSWLRCALIRKSLTTGPVTVVRTRLRPKVTKAAFLCLCAVGSSFTPLLSTGLHGHVCRTHHGHPLSDAAIVIAKEDCSTSLFKVCSRSKEGVEWRQEVQVRQASQGEHGRGDFGHSRRSGLLNGCLLRCGSDKSERS